MDKLVFSCFLLGSLTPDPGPTDSCALNAYCATGLTNVGCNPPPITGGSACEGKSPEVLEILEADQTYTLDRLNEIRDRFSSGYYGNDKSNRMFKLQWDANLASQAGNNVRSCVFGRDACRNTADYANVGQFFATFVSSTSFIETLAVDDKIGALISANNYFFPYLDGRASLSSYSQSTDTENAANILNDRSTKVGCALMKWIEGDQTFLYFVCNFSANVIEGQPIYTAAATAGMGCATTDTTYPSLCLT